MGYEEAIINPVKGRRAPDLGPVAVMAAMETDTAALVRKIDAGPTRKSTPLMMSRVYRTAAGYSVTGPMMGAPYAVAVMETLIAWGATSILFWGLCGAVAEGVGIGDIVIPSGAIIDEGTSRHYGRDLHATVSPSSSRQPALKRFLENNGVPVKEGLVWTTDGVFRETREQVLTFRKKGALAVEMEASALFSVAAFRGIDIAAVLVVSDDLSTLDWRPGFTDERFKAACRQMPALIDGFCHFLQGELAS